MWQYTVQVRDEWPTCMYTQNAHTTFTQTCVENKCQHTHLRTFDARFLLLFTLITVLSVAFICTTTKKRQKTIPTNAAKRTSPLTKIQPIHFFLLKQVNSKKHKMYTNLLVTCPQITYLHEVIFGYFPIIVQIIDFKGD